MIRAGGASLRGMRDENQDRWLARVSDDGRRAVGAVADGIGGLPGGAGAAEAAIETVERFAEWLFGGESIDEDTLRSRVRRLYAEANDAVIEGSNVRSGTTLVSVILTEEFRLVANVGDSRAWLLHRSESGEDGLQRLTRDHSVAEELFREGVISKEEAERSARRHILTRALGDPERPSVDVTLEGASRVGDLLILTSDGAHEPSDAFTAARVRERVESTADPEAACESLCRDAVEAGSTDNATLVILAVGQG